jgi:CheY-like chemotaxis protein
MESPRRVHAPSATATILVVDDDALINIGTVDMIEDLGHRAIEAYSGREALQILADGQRIDAMLTDYAMPGMNGIELAIKARELRPDLQILLASGYAELPDGSTTDLPRLSKPFRQEELASLLRQVLFSSQA